MVKPLLLVSTCGTSLLTNGSSPEDRNWLTKIANHVEVDDTARLETIAFARREALKTADEAMRRRMSAELNGIAAVLKRYQHTQVFHLIVHTDTAPGETTAKLVQEALGGHVALLSADGLRTDSLVSFREALAELTRKLDEQVRAYREQGWFVVFNLTGGFKSLNGYLQTLGMLLADRSVFLFEGAPELMEIPRLPVRLAELEELREHANLFRRLALGYPVKEDDAEGVPEALLMKLDGEVARSMLGDLVWARHRAELLGEKLHSPLSNKVRISDAVKKAFDKLETGERVHVNEAIDAFSAYVDVNRAPPASHTIKKLQGNPVPGSTHEIYAWTDGAAGRLFGHYEQDGIFVFDRLDKHL